MCGHLGRAFAVIVGRLVRELDRVVRHRDIALARLWVHDALSPIATHENVTLVDALDVARDDRHLAATTGRVEHEHRYRHAVHPAAQTLVQRLSGLDGGAQVIGADHGVALKQVIRLHPRPEQATHQRAQRAHARVHTAQEDGLIADGDTRVDEPLTSGTRVGCELLDVIEVSVDEQRVVLAQRARELVIDPHRTHHRQPRTDADRLDVWDGAQAAEQIVEAPRRQQERIAAG